MALPSPTFSESWHRVAQQRIYLRASVRIRRQRYRGELWFVVENPLTNEFFRLTQPAYALIARLDPGRTVDEVWREQIEKYPDDAPGQGEVLRLLAGLYFANLLQYDQTTNTSDLFERYRKRRQREWRGRLKNIWFSRFPLLDPDSFLNSTMPVMGKLLTRWGGVVWVGVILAAFKVVADNWESLMGQSKGVLAPDNLLLLYLGLVTSKTIHEFGHAYVTKKYEGEVHVMGVMLMVFTLIPYVDASSSLGFRSRGQRLMVGAAGMVFELFFAALMTFFWANTGQGSLHDLAYNMMFTASVSTLLFNLNPLLRFDGYYMLSDILEIPNLAQRSATQLTYLAERWLFGVKSLEGPARSRREAFWLSIYGVGSGIYRVLVSFSILLLIADRFFLLGIAIAAGCAVLWMALPAIRFIRYLATSPKLERHRPRALAVTGMMLLLGLGGLNWLPVPSHFRAPGVVQSREWTQIVNETAGQVVEVVAASKSPVKSGQPLLRLHNSELEFEIRRALASQREIESRIHLAVARRASDIKPLRGLLETATNRLAKLLADQESLVVRARHDGLWVAPELPDTVGRWMPRGTPVGLLVNPVSFQFIATVRQEEAAALFNRRLTGAEIRLNGQAGKVIHSPRWLVVPGGQGVLPSPVLGARAGGEMAVAADDPRGVKTAEPFFEIRAELPSSVALNLLNGRSGTVRFNQDWEPLLPRWIRGLRQLLQKRYQL